MYLCYLDFDGVLHDSSVWLTHDRRIILDTPGRRLFEWDSVLVNLLLPHPQVKIVLSTSWVRIKGFDYAKSQLDPLIASRVIGATFNNEVLAAEQLALLPRGMQILEDAQHRDPLDWFAIDDDRFDWPDRARGKLVKTNGAFGLSEVPVQEDIRRRLAVWRSQS